MDTKLIVGVLVGVAVLGGGVYFFSETATAPSGSDTVLSGDSMDQLAAVGALTSGKFEGSFADLSTRGGEWKCMVDTSTAEAVSSGSVYVSQKNVRGDFTSDVASYGQVESHIITDGESVYTWTSVMPQGFKMKMVATGNDSGKPSGQGGDANQKYSYDCEPFTVDASLFVVPSDIQFTTI